MSAAGVRRNIFKIEGELFLKVSYIIRHVQQLLMKNISFAEVQNRLSLRTISSAFSHFDDACTYWYLVELNRSWKKIL